MEITRLNPGERAPDTDDRVYIDCISDGQWMWTGSVKVSDAAIFGASQGDYPIAGEAEAAALAWAEGHGAAEILIETNYS